MTAARELTAYDVKRLPVILDRLEQQHAADLAALERSCARAGARVPHAAAAWPDVRAEVQRLDDLADAIAQHRGYLCATRPEDCWLLAPHLAHYADRLGITYPVTQPAKVFSFPVVIDGDLPENVLRITSGTDYLDIVLGGD